MSWVLNSNRVGRFLRLAGSDFQTYGAAKLNELSPNDFTLCFGCLKASGMRIAGCVKFDMHRAK